MRILYGVCGEGMGHATRSAVVGGHLERCGHEVTYASAGLALDYLRSRSPRECLRVLGPTLTFKDNRLSPVATLIANAFRMSVAPLLNLPASVGALRVRPDVVISDFDPWAALVAHSLQTPLIAVDNIHFVTRCEHPPAIDDGQDAAARGVTRAVVEGVVPGAKLYMVTSLFPTVPTRARTTVHLPILRDAVIRIRRSGAKTEDHLLSYFNASADHTSVGRAVASVGLPVRAYGAPGSFSEDEFFRDLATCRGVISGAGFSLMSEAVYLGKPVLALPFEGQYEQALNANCLERLDYGARWRGMSSAALQQFVGELPRRAERLRELRHDDNLELLQSVEEALAA